jgi:hypothetical protein
MTSVVGTQHKSINCFSIYYLILRFWYFVASKLLVSVCQTTWCYMPENGSYCLSQWEFQISYFLENAWMEGCSEIHSFVFMYFYFLVYVIKFHGSLLVETYNIKFNLKIWQCWRLNMHTGKVWPLLMQILSASGTE